MNWEEGGEERAREMQHGAPRFTSGKIAGGEQRIPTADSGAFSWGRRQMS